MRYGKETEPKALAAYQLLLGAPVAVGGFVTHEHYPLCADSPDGLIGLKEGCVEFKCPAPHTHGSYLVGDKVPDEYICQVDWHLFVTGRGWCDFVSYCPKFPPDLQLFVVRRERDDAAMKAMEEKVVTFLDTYMEHLDRLGLRL